MNIISTTLQNYTKDILEEIRKSTSDFYQPVSVKHTIFEQAYMKFLNRNLNYFDFENMVAQTTENDEFNPEFTKTLEFCNYSRTLTNTYSPFGRMCVWCVPPRSKILPHLDAFEYHHNIVRNIFILSENTLNKHKIVIGDTVVDSRAGLYFQFNPATEVHSFINNSATPYYFLGYDFWIQDKLEQALQRVNVQEVINNKGRLSSYGADGTKFKYMSKH